MQLNEIISKFEKPKPNGSNSYMVKCPCHNDGTQSLCISERDGKILLNCFAGCRTEDITHAVGLEMKDLFTKSQTFVQKPPSVEYNYSDTLKKVRFYRYDKLTNEWHKFFCWKHKDNSGVWKKDMGGKEVPLYKQNLLNNAAENDVIYIVEGEKDTETMINAIHLKAVSAPNGATKGKQGKKWDTRYNQLFKSLNVAIIPDNDEIGKEYAQTIAENLLPYAKSVKIIDLVTEWDKLKPKGDITDIYETEVPPKGKTKAESIAFKLSALYDVTPAYETSQTAAMQTEETEKPVKYAPPVWAYEDNGQWKIDEKVYITEFVKTHGVKCINGELWTVDGAINNEDAKKIIMDEVINYVKTNHGDKAEKLLKGIKIYCYCEPLKPNLDKLHFLNGTLSKDESGLFTVWSNEKEFCINRINTNYNPSAAKPQLFYNYLNTVYHTDDIKTLQQYCGYCLIPTTLLQKALFVIGEGGEGKSITGTVLNAVFGSKNCYNNSINTIEQRFGIANIENKLLFIDDDLSENALKSSRQFKSLVTNKNDIQADKKFVQSNIIKSYVRFLVFGNFALQSLYDTSEGFTRRQLVLQAKPKDKNRVDNFMLDKEIVSNETEGVLLWIIDGLNELLKNKYHMFVSERTQAESDRLKKENDSVLCFLEECTDIIISPEQKTHSYNLYLTYSDFCEYNTLIALKQKSFITALKSKGKSRKIVYDINVKIGGERRRGFTGIGIKPNRQYPYYS